MNVINNESYFDWHLREVQTMKIRDPVRRLLLDISMAESRIWVLIRDAGLDPFGAMGVEIPILRKRLYGALGL